MKSTIFEKFNAAPEHEPRHKEWTEYINAGGRGTGLNEVLPKDPQTGITKSLIELGDSDTAIEYHIRLARAVGYGNIVVGAGDHRNVAKHLENEVWKHEDLAVATTEKQEDTGGDLIKAVRSPENHFGKYVLIKNVDTFVLLDEDEVMEQHEASGAGATFVVSERKGMKNYNALVVGWDGRILGNDEAADTSKDPAYDEKDVAYRASSTGIIAINTDILKEYPWQPGDGPLSIYRDVLPELMRQGKLHAYNNRELMMYDVGKKESYQKTIQNPAFIKILQEFEKQLKNKHSPV